MNHQASKIGLSTLILSTIAVAAVLYVLNSILVPLVLAGFLAIIFKPLVHALSRRGLPTWVGLIVVLIISGAAIYGISIIVSWGVQAAILKGPEYAEKLKLIVAEAQKIVGRVGGRLGEPAFQHLENVISPESALNVAGSWVGSAVSIIGDGAMVLLFLIFMVLGGEDFPKKLEAAFRGTSSFNLVTVYENLNDKVLRYLRIKTIINLATGLAVYTVLALFGVDFAPVIGLLAFFFNYIPSIGSFIMTVIPGVVAALQFESLGYAIIVVLVLIVVQNLIGNVIEPKVMGESLNLSPVVILFSLVFWGWMWGIVGMVLSVPIMAIIKTIMEQFPTTRPIAVLMGNGAPPYDPADDLDATAEAEGDL